MLYKFSDLQVSQFMCIGAAAMVVGALCMPLVTHATTAEDSPAQPNNMNQVRMSQSEAEHSEMQHGEKTEGDVMLKGKRYADNAHGTMQHGSKGHAHKMIDVSDWAAVPSVSMNVDKDAKRGWNIHIEAQNFEFTPENVNADNQEGEGHAHLFVDGKKVARVYSPWFHLPALSEGTHTIRVELNANDHSTLALGDAPIEFVTTIEEK